MSKNEHTVISWLLEENEPSIRYQAIEIYRSIFMGYLWSGCREDTAGIYPGGGHVK